MSFILFLASLAVMKWAMAGEPSPELTASRCPPRNEPVPAEASADLSLLALNQALGVAVTPDVSETAPETGAKTDTSVSP